ncbi:type II toxin-antitoxin system Phd/YefM family antitoxin [Microbacterium lacticum]
MKTVSMTEYNQHPSRVARAVEAEGEVVVMRRGRPVLRIVRVDDTSDPVEAMIAAGVLTAPRAESPRSQRPLPGPAALTDVGALLDDDRDGSF